MGLTIYSTGHHAAERGLRIRRERPDDRVFALAGNPNVGKSTVFNALTGLNQHTGNWPGKTVTVAQGHFTRNGRGAVLVDVPGTYALTARSEDERVARDFICFAPIDGAVVVCDATAPERSLRLVLQIMEVVPHVIVCMNLTDEARKKNITVDCDALSEQLGVPVIATAARSGQGLDALARAMLNPDSGPLLYRLRTAACGKVMYPAPLENALDALQPLVEQYAERPISARWAALQLLSGDEPLVTRICDESGISPQKQRFLLHRADELRCTMHKHGRTVQQVRDMITETVVHRAEQLTARCVAFEDPLYHARDRRLDRLLMGRFTAVPIMLLLLLFLFWLTIYGANACSATLQRLLFGLGEWLARGLQALALPAAVCDALVNGVWRVLAWVVSVMLPPMAIFFPLFTLLEDVGYLPRVAFVLDRTFHRAGTCGMQALTMCMGFGCNAAGVTGCRIIRSPRERLIAVLTNSFVPCNGRFPILIAMISLFFGAQSGSLRGAVLLTMLVLVAVAATLLVSKLLSCTVLRSTDSAFTLELPPYRRPQLGQVLVRSVLDRTLFVLGRAAAVAAPAGLLIWAMANVHVNGSSLLLHCAQALDPFARLLGLDGVILMAFLLGFPANETVVPIMVMAYSSLGTLQELSNGALHGLLLANGWTPLTALCVMVFTLFHWPCSTTCRTIQKETGKLRWTLLAAVLPTVCGAVLCFLIALCAQIIG